MSFTKINVIHLAYVVMIFLGMSANISFAQTIKIGAILNLTGYGALWGENSQRGIIMAQEEINSNGGIAGHKLEIFFEDTKGGSLTAVAAAAQKLVHINKVVLLITQWSGDTNVAWSIAHRANVPTLTVSAGAPDFVGNRSLLYRIWGSDSALVNNIATHIKKNKLTRPYVFLTEDAYCQRMLVELQRVLKNDGVNLIGYSELQANEQDLSVVTAKATKYNPDAIISFLYYPQQAALMKQLRKLRFNAHTFGLLGSDSQEFLELAGEAADGLIIPTYAAGTVDFKERFFRRWGQEPWLSADTAYDSIFILRYIDLTDPSKISLGDLANGSSFQGASGLVQMLPNGDRAARATTSLVVRNGRARDLNGDFE